MRNPLFLLAAVCVSLGIVLATSQAAADAKGEAVLKEAFKTLHAAKSFTATLTISVDAPGAPDPLFKGAVAAMKPNLLMVELHGPFTMLYVADGKSYFSYRADRNSYTKAELKAAPTEFLGQWEGEIDAFFGGPKNVDKVTVTYVGTEKIGSVDCHVINAKPKTNVVGAEVRYFIGQKDHLIRRAVLTLPTGAQSTVKQTNNMTDINLKATKKAADFTFKPPAGSKEQPAAAAGTI